MAVMTTLMRAATTGSGSRSAYSARSSRAAVIHSGDRKGCSATSVRLLWSGAVDDQKPFLERRCLYSGHVGYSDGFTLDGQLCVAIYNASRAMTSCYRPLLDRIGLTYSQYTVMLVLWEADQVALRDLGELLHLDSGTLSPLLKRLEKQGFVTRRRDHDDERVLRVSLTDEGRDLRAQAKKVQAEVEAMTGLDHRDLVTLRDDLNSLSEYMRNASQEG